MPTADLITFARTVTASHPLVLLIVVYVLLLAQQRVWRVQRIGVAAWPVWGAVYLAIVAWYCLTPGYFDHIEPSTAAISARMAGGGAPYPPPPESSYLGLPYGPLLFEVHAFALSALGRSVTLTKVVSAVAALLSAGLVACAVGWRSGNGREAANAVALGFLAFGPMSFWVRAEPLLCAAVAVAIVAAQMAGRKGGLLLGAATGAAFCLKVTAPLYTLPLWIHMWRSHGNRKAVATALACVGAIAVILSSFAPGSVSTAGYAAILLDTARHGLRVRSVVTQVEWALLFAALGLATTPRVDRSSRDWTGIGFAAALAAMVPIASKIGAGPYHFIPFVPVAIFLGYRGRRDTSVAVRAVFLTLLLVAVPAQVYWLRALDGRRSLAEAGEIAALAARHDHPYAVGYGQSSRPSLMRATPALAGQPYLIDAPSVADRKLSATADLRFETSPIRACGIRTWLIPAGDTPFAVPDPYHPTKTLFPSDFLSAFGRTYRLVERGEYFDVWTCGE